MRERARGIGVYIAVSFVLGSLLFLLFGCARLFNKPPVADFTITPASGPAPLTVTFDASSSFDPDGRIVRYEWSNGGIPLGTGKIRTHTYPDPGYYEMTLTVYDKQNASDSMTRPFTVTTRRVPPSPSFVDIKDAAESYLGTDTALWVYHYGSSYYYGNAVLMARETTQKGTFDAWLTVRHMYHGDTADRWSYYASKYRALSGAYSNKFFVFITEQTAYTPFVSLSAHPNPFPWGDLKQGMVLWRVGWGKQYEGGSTKFSPHIDFGTVTSLNDPSNPNSIAYSASGEFGLSGSIVLYYEDRNKDGIATPDEFWYIGLHDAQSYNNGGVGTPTAWATYGYPETNSLVTVPLQLSRYSGWSVATFSKELNKEETWGIIQKALQEFDKAIIEHR